MRKPRITMRRLMIAVAACGLLIWVGDRLYVYWVRLPLYRDRVRFHALHETARITRLQDATHTAGPEELVQLNRAWAAYHATMRQKYERAVASPWITVPPDPPTPNFLSDSKTGRSVDLHYQ